MLYNIDNNVLVAVNIITPSEEKLHFKSRSSSMSETENYIDIEHDKIIIGNKKQDLMSVMKNPFSSEE